MPTYYRRLSLALTFIILFSTFNFHLMTVKASCTLQGTVYIDFNMNGVRDVDESGVPDVAVKVFDSMRPIATVLGSAVTDQNGDFVLDLSQIDDVVIRVEYTNLPEALVPAPSFGSVDYDAQRLSTTVLFGSCDNDVAFEGMNQILFTQDAYCAVFCETAGIELGNRVWFDQDGNGRQDPDESPMSNVVISLYMETAEEKRLVAQTTTDSRGRYYFNARTIDDYRSETGKVLDIRNVTYLDINDNGRYEESEPRGVMPNSTYLIMIDNPINFLNEGDPLWGYYVTLPFANPDNIEHSEIRDSDGLAKNSAERVGLANTVSILVETGDLGSVDHSLDFGFVLEAQDIPPTATPTLTPTLTPTVTFTPSVTPTLTPSFTPTQTSSPTATLTFTATPTPTNTMGMSPTVEPTSSSTEMDTPTLEPSASKEPDDD